MEWCCEEFRESLDSMYEQIFKHRKEDFGGQPITIKPDYGLYYNGKRTSTATGNATERKVVFSQLSNQLLWYICWYGYRMWINESQNVDEEDLKKRLHIIDSNDEVLKTLTCKNLEYWNDENMVLTFCYATSFILFHEVVHIVKGHTYFNSNYDVRPLDELRRNEYDADEYAMMAIMQVARENDQLDIAYIGIICAQCLLFFERKSDVDYEHSAHGNPMDRIEQKFEMMDCDTTSYRSIVESLNQLADIFIEEKYRDAQQ